MVVSVDLEVLMETKDLKVIVSSLEGVRANLQKRAIAFAVVGNEALAKSEQFDANMVDNQIKCLEHIMGAGE